MKIWILGAAGQLGKALSDQCSSAEIAFHPSGKEEGDVTDLEKLHRVAQGGSWTHIINCAAYTDVDRAEKDVKRAFAVNADGPENLGIVAKEHGIQVVHVSTDYVFDGEKRTPYLETDRPNPLGVYGKSKLEGEERLLEQFPSACIVRTSWIFGHRGKNFISTLLEKLQTKERVEAVDDQINKATYDRDLAKALLHLCSHSGLFHYANSKPMSRFAIAKDFYAEGKKRGLSMKCQKIIPISADAYPALSPRPKFSALSTEKVSRVLGRKPLLWETVLEDYFNHVEARL